MEEYNDLLNLTADDFKTDEKGKIERYRPTAKAGADNVYTSVVRFIPWFKNPKESIKSKWTCWLVNPDNDEGKYVDCPSSVGQKSLLQDTYWKLKKSESIADQKLAQNFSRRQQFASLVQVIEDKHNPDLVGKILIYQYGVKIHKKIMGEMKPQYGSPHIPFDLFTGKGFLFNITLVSGYNNYDECKFLTEPVPVKIGSENISEKSPENLQIIVDFLKENSPDLDVYGYREWTDEVNEFVLTVIRNTVPKGRISEALLKKSNTQNANTNQKTVTAETTVDSDEDAEDVKYPSDIPNLELSKVSDVDLSTDDEDFDDDLYSKL